MWASTATGFNVGVDVGIDPYIETGGACHSTYRSVSEGFGRLIAAPTGTLGACLTAGWRTPLRGARWSLQNRYTLLKFDNGFHIDIFHAVYYNVPQMRSCAVWLRHGKDGEQNGKA